MSNPTPAPPLARYSYYSVFRRGAAADIAATAADPLSGSFSAPRVAPAVALQVTASGPDMSKPLSSGPVDASGNSRLFLYGPGDVIGFDKRHIVLTEPADGTVNFEPNYFAGLEFDDPDIPWLFTPAQAVPTTGTPAQEKLRPWLVLVALTSNEFKLTKASTAQGLDWISVSNSPQVLPDLGDSWAWAHAQLTGSLDPGDTLQDVVTHEPQRFVARLLCPRALQPDTQYTAFLAPAFLMGAQAGLPPTASPPATATDPLGPAWQIGDAVVNLPVYYSFSFSTGDAGDFESLALRLKPTALTGVGSRALAVDDPRNRAAWNVRPATSAGATLDLHGALDTIPPPGAPPQPDEWNSTDEATFKPALASVINAATPASGNPSDPDPVVVPPIYGRYHAAVRSVSATGAGWVNELNLDPRLRAPAGLGAQVVTAQRSALMASAWRQIAGIELANRILRHAQMARAALQQTYQSTFSAISSVMLLVLGCNVLKRIGIGTGASAGTAWSAIASSPIPWRALFPAFQRLVRPFGPLRSQQGQAGASVDGLVSGLNGGSVTLTAPGGPGSGTASVAPPSGGATGSVGTATTGSEAGPLGGVLGPVPGWLQPYAVVLAFLVVIAALILDAVILIAGLAGGWLSATVALAVVILVLAILIAWWLLGATSTTTPTGAGSTTTTGPGASPTGYGTPQPGPGGVSVLTSSVNVPGLSGYQVVSVGAVPAAGTVSIGTDSADASALRGTLQGALTMLNGVAAAQTAPASINLDSLANLVLGALDPTGTVVRRALSLVKLDPRLNWAPSDLIEPVMAAPDFPQPMYAPLCELSQEFLLPGVGQIRSESIGLLQPNMAFIESYMVGLNFEMGRQLLWNGYPTDQRGSYFRQFWDVSGYVPGPSDPPLNSPQLAEELKDIPPIHTWGPATDIGTHPNPLRPASGSVLVLLIRGELLRRYPTTHVYAVPAQLQAQPDGSLKRIPNVDPSEELHPLFRGTMAPDLSYFGFGLSPATVLSGPDHPGYYFVLQQHPTQPRFGLETDGSPVSWQCFPSGFATVAAQSAPAGVSPPPPLPSGWGSDAATMASMTFRDPVRVAIHADLMLPGGKASP